MPTYMLNVMFTTDPDDDSLLTEQVVADELRAWLESLRAYVHKVEVQTLVPPPTCGEEAGE